MRRSKEPTVARELRAKIVLWDVWLRIFFMAESALIYSDLTEKIIAWAIRVQNTLGCGFVEPVYQKAMYHELTKAGLRVEAEKGIHVI